MKKEESLLATVLIKEHEFITIFNEVNFFAFSFFPLFLSRLNIIINICWSKT